MFRSGKGRLSRSALRNSIFVRPCSAARGILSSRAFRRDRKRSPLRWARRVRTGFRVPVAKTLEPAASGVSPCCRRRNGCYRLVARHICETTDLEVLIRAYSELYPNISRDEEGMQRLFKQFSFPGGIPSHVAPETPGSIHE